MVVFFMMRIPDAVLYWISLDEMHPIPALRANILAISLWTTVFLGAVWIRKRWARYALLVCVCYVVLVDILVMSTLLPSDFHLRPFPTITITARMLFYVGAATMLIRSRSIRHLCTRP